MGKGARPCNASRSNGATRARGIAQCLSALHAEAPLPEPERAELLHALERKPYAPARQRELALSVAGINPRSPGE